MTPTDSAPDNEYSHGYWRERAAYWDRNADGIAEMADRLNQPLLDAVGIETGQRVLDLASGTGEPALSIARRVGPEGHVTSTDLVAEMLDGTRRRLEAAGMRNVDCRVADMEALPFADATFDRVTCRFGIMFTNDPGRALAEARRVLKPGGRAGFLVWGPRADTSQFEVFAAAAERVLGSGSELDLDSPFRFGAEGSLNTAMTAAGFVETEEQALRFEPKIPASEPFWRPHIDMTFGPLAADPARRAALDSAIAEGFAAYRAGDAYRLKMHVRIGTGRRPAET